MSEPPYTPPRLEGSRLPRPAPSYQTPSPSRRTPSRPVPRSPSDYASQPPSTSSRIPFGIPFDAADYSPTRPSRHAFPDGLNYSPFSPVLPRQPALSRQASRDTSKFEQSYHPVNEFMSTSSRTPYLKHYGSRMNTNITTDASPLAPYSSRPVLPQAPYEKTNESAAAGSSGADPVIKDFYISEPSTRQGMPSSPPISHKRNRHGVGFAPGSFQGSAVDTLGVFGGPGVELDDLGGGRSGTVRGKVTETGNPRADLARPKPHRGYTGDSASTQPGAASHGRPMAEDVGSYGPSLHSAPFTRQSEMQSFFSDDTSDIVYRSSLGYRAKQFLGKLCSCCGRRPSGGAHSTTQGQQ
ncbi:MAG: Vacuolar fusion protein mon1 [Chaenotheca gracillima]|nr:MAG: Vacuolar fusion protein mon1 [Chaenotheca gracillima]